MQPGTWQPRGGGSPSKGIHLPNDDIDPSQRYFFIHIMKTGGSTFRSHLKRNFRKPQIYPLLGQVADLEHAYTYPNSLRSLTEEDHLRYRAYAGHYPPVAVELIGTDIITLSLLREPVARTISVLKHCKRNIDRCEEMTFEEIYEDPWVYPMSVLNHQAKLYSMTLDDPLESCLDPLEVDESRFKMAIARMETIDVLGIHAHYDQFLQDLTDRYRWAFKSIDNREVSNARWKPPASFLKRIANDNDADMAFYDASLVRYQSLHKPSPVHSIPDGPLRSIVGQFRERRKRASMGSTRVSPDNRRESLQRSET